MTRSIHDTHVTIKTLPSRGVPYEPDTKISLRALKLGEVDYVFEHKDKVTDIIKYISDRDVIRGIEVPELTVDDWEFIELTLVSMTFPGAKFELTGSCTKCGDTLQVIELKDLDDNVIRTIEVRPETKAIVLPRDISFNTLDDLVEWPIEVDLSVGTTQVDFLRLKHYTELVDVDKVQQRDWTPLKLAEKMCGYSSDELAYTDGAILTYVREKLFHGVLNQFNVTCNVCKTVYPITTAWEVADFIPFWQGGGSAGDRVRFGSGSKSKRNESA